MGYLTTFTIYNDGVDLVKKHPEEFAEKIYEGVISMREPHDASLGNFCNLINIQRTRHADDHTIYVHMGNCVTEVNPYSSEFEQLMERCPDYTEKLIKYLDTQVKSLKRKLKEKKAATP